MPIEIERKFLVTGNAWRTGEAGVVFKQGYLNSRKERVVRVRTMGDRGRLTVKGLNKGMQRLEFEYDIPLNDALQLLKELCEKPIIEKTRYFRNYEGLLWEVDEFHGENEGLIVAEVELGSEDQRVPLPPWIGEEVTDDARYFNSNLIQHPFKDWHD